MHGDDVVNDPQHLACDRWTTCQQKTQLEWETEYPLTNWLMREYLIYEQGRTLGHAPRAATGAETAARTAESDQVFLVAGFTAYPQKSMFEPAALQVVLEFPLHIARQHPALPTPVSWLIST
jgi:hypothetical protein